MQSDKNCAFVTTLMIYSLFGYKYFFEQWRNKVKSTLCTVEQDVGQPLSWLQVNSDLCRTQTLPIQTPSIQTCPNPDPLITQTPPPQLIPSQLRLLQFRPLPIQTPQFRHLIIQTLSTHTPKLKPSQFRPPINSDSYWFRTFRNVYVTQNTQCGSAQYI